MSAHEWRSTKRDEWTFCAICGTHFPVGEDGQFVWDGTDQKVGTRRPTPTDVTASAARGEEG